MTRLQPQTPFEWLTASLFFEMAIFFAPIEPVSHVEESHITKPEIGDRIEGDAVDLELAFDGQQHNGKGQEWHGSEEEKGDGVQPRNFISPSSSFADKVLHFPVNFSFTSIPFALWLSVAYFSMTTQQTRTLEIRTQRK